MKDFYTNVAVDIDGYGSPKELLVVGFNDEGRYQSRIPIKDCDLHIFKDDPTRSSEYRTIDGRHVTKHNFARWRDARQFVRENQGISNSKLYGIHSKMSAKNLVDHYINYTWDKEVPYDFTKLTTAVIDIEVAADEGFPSVVDAEKPITAIAVKVRSQTIVYGCGDFTPKETNHHYAKCTDEKHLLLKFLDDWEKLKVDIITGWNCELFDVPYIVNRMFNVLGEKEIFRLSPWHIVEEGRLSKFAKVPGPGQFPNPRNSAAAAAALSNKEGKWGKTAYDILGISIIDYLAAYKKFTYTQQESYSLDNISFVELGEKKLDYSEYDGLMGLYKNNYQKFIEYNIKDVELVSRLDDKMKLLELMAAISYDGHVNLNDAFTSVRLWDIIIHNYLLKKKIVVPMIDLSIKERQNQGGYVKDPHKGKIHKWIASFDLNSLYPHLIMQYNISPETYKGVHPNKTSVNSILDGAYKGIDNPDDCAITGAGVMYSKDIRGFLPTLMERTYADRVIWKDKLKKAKKAGNKNEISRCDNMQMAKKIQLNSAYGALANPAFRWFKMEHAEGITLSGQMAIRWIEKKINIYMNEKFNTENQDYVIAIDTDSVYVSFEKMVDDSKPIPDNVEMLDQYIQKTMEPNIDKWYQELADYTNAYEQKMIMKREVIADRGVWTAKKHYALNVWDMEGFRYDKPERKIMGLESVKSSTPFICRRAIEKSLEIMLNENEDRFIEYIEEFKNEFRNLPYESVAFPRGVSDIDKWCERTQTQVVPKKGTPIHVRGAITFNNMLIEHNLMNKYETIKNSDKIKFCYLKLPNPSKEHVISCPQALPKQFGLDKYIDYDKQFEKSFLGPMQAIADAAGWKTEKIVTLEDFWK